MKNKETKCSKIFNKEEKSLKNQLVVYFLATGIIPLMIFALISSMIIKSSMYKSEISSMKQISSMATENLDKWGENNILLVEEIADSQTVKSNLIDNIQSDLKMKQAQDTSIDNIMYIDNYGNVLADSLGSKNIDIKDENYFQDITCGYSYVSDVIIDENNKMPIIIFSAPIKNDGEISGYIVSKIKTSSIEKSIGNVFFTQEGNIFTFNSNGYITYHKDDSRIMNENIISNNSSELSIGAKKALDGNFNSIDYVYNDEKGVAVYNFISSLRWGTMTTKPNEEIYSGFKSVFITSIPLIIILVSIICLLAFSILNKFIKPISKLAGLTKRVAEGDLVAECNISSYKEIHEIGNDFNEMVKSLKGLVKNIYDKSDNLKSGAERLNELSASAEITSIDISKAMEEIAQGSVEQATKTDDTLIQVRTLDEKVNELMHKLEEINKELDISERALSNGSKDMKELSNTTEVQHKLIGQAVGEVGQLSSSVGNIDKIINTISEIADQTSMLALNASIEAARAGEGGKGFSVVAEEVGKLANQSQEATKQIAHVLENIKNKANSTTEIMGSIDRSMKVQISAVDETINNFDQIILADSKIGDNIKSFNKLIDYVNDFSNNLLELIEALASSSEEGAAVAEEVTASSENQISVVEQVKECGDEIMEIVNELEMNIDKFTIE